MRSETDHDVPKDIVSILRRFFAAEFISDVREEAQQALQGEDLVQVVKELGQYLVSDDSTQRRESVTLLQGIVKLRADISPRQLPHLLAFFCSRLSDWSSVEPAVQGICEIYTRHIRETDNLAYPSEDESTRARELSDLSLLLGYAKSSDLPACKETMAERVLTKLLINVHAPSFGRQVRHSVLSLLKVLIKYFSHELVAEIIVKGVAIEGEDERDPECLLRFFECIDALFEKSLIEEESKASEELFDTLKSYFPIQTMDDSDTAQLRHMLNACMVRFGLKSIEFLSPQLNDPSRAEHAFSALVQIGKERSIDLLPFILSEWCMSPSPLLEKLWQSTIEDADPSYVETLIDHLKQKGEVDMLVVTGNANPSKAAMVISSSRECGFFMELIKKLKFDDSCHAIPVSSEYAIPIAQRLADDLPTSLHIISRMVPLIQSDVLLVKKIGLEISQGIQGKDADRCLGNIFALRNVELISELDLFSILDRLIRVESTEAALSQVIRAIYSDHQDLVVEKMSGHWELASRAFSDPDLSVWVLDRVSLDSLPSVVIAEIVISICPIKEQQCINIVHECLVESGRVDLLSYLDGQEIFIVKALGSTPSVYEDLLASVIAFPSVATVQTAISASLHVVSAEKCLRILRYCDSCSVWAAGVCELQKHSPELDLLDQLTEDRVEALMRLEDAKFVIEKISNQLSLDVVPASVASRVLSCVDRLDYQLAEQVILAPDTDVFTFRLAIKYLVLNPNTCPDFIQRLIANIKSQLCERPMVRFSAVQTLAVLPEMVASGKLESVRSYTLLFLHKLLQKEPKRIVRKQIAVAITNWMA